MALLEIAFLLFSVLVLARSSEMVISSSITLSRFFKINQLAVGFILVAIATSLPELSVSVTSSLAGEGALSAGNVFGSNIANILIILGVGAFLYGVKISPGNMKDIALVLVITTLISVYMLYSSSVEQKALGFIEGATLLVVFSVYVWQVLKRKKPANNSAAHKVSKKKALRAFLEFGMGILVVVVSSAFVVDSAVSLATMLGIAQSFIGATVIAIGTSLPELSTALQALRRKHYGLVLGNAIGSNMANITLVLGVASGINPITVHIPVFIAALLFAVVANTVLFYSAAVNRGIGRLGGALFLLIYILYLSAILGLQAGEIGAV